MSWRLSLYQRGKNKTSDKSTFDQKTMDLFVKNSGLQHIAVTVLKNLDPKSLENCRQVNEAWKHLIDTTENLQYTVYSEELYRISDDYEHLFDYWPQWFQMFEDFISKKSLEELKYFTDFINDYLYRCQIKKESPFHFAIKNSDLEMIQMLAENMSDLNEKSKKQDGATGFLIAAKCGRSNVVEYLIQKSAEMTKINLNAIDDFGQSAYMWALMKGRKKILEILRKYPNIRNR